MPRPFGLDDASAAEWELSFEDDFDSPEINGSKWHVGYRNGQFEYYRRVGATHPGAYTSPECLYEISDGLLRLRVDGARPVRPHVGSPCVSCVMTSDHRYGRDRTEATIFKKFGQKYGWFETRCRIAKGQGLESAFWLHQVDPLHQEFTPEGLPNKAEGALEFDIFEAWGDPPEALRFQMNVHYAPDAHWRMLEPDPDNAFHVWSLEWEEGLARWRLDGRVVREYRGPTPQREMFVLLALFHFRHHPEHVESDLAYPVSFDIDYVRVFRRRAPGGTVSPSAQ